MVCAGEVDETFGAGGDEGVCAGGRGFPQTVSLHLLGDHAALGPARSAAADGFLAASGHLAELFSGKGYQVSR